MPVTALCQPVLLRAQLPCHPSPLGSVPWAVLVTAGECSLSQMDGICPFDGIFQGQNNLKATHNDVKSIRFLLSCNTVQGHKNPTSLPGGVPLKIRSCCYPLWQGRKFSGSLTQYRSLTVGQSNNPNKSILTSSNEGFAFGDLGPNCWHWTPKSSFFPSLRLGIALKAGRGQKIFMCSSDILYSVSSPGVPCSRSQPQWGWVYSESC